VLAALDAQQAHSGPEADKGPAGDDGEAP
jgi:hypothetical protein